MEGLQASGFRFRSVFRQRGPLFRHPKKVPLRRRAVDDARQIAAIRGQPQTFQGMLARFFGL
jgi:hypothetical protein